MATSPARDVAIVTPWLPTREQPFRGAFVRAMVDATAPGCDRATVYHLDAWVAAMGPRRERRVLRAYRELAPRNRGLAPTVGGARLRYLPVPIPRGHGHAEIARRYAREFRTALGGRPIDAPVVHAHVGLPGGWAALHNARPDARVYVTEHATFLANVLDEPDGRAMYDELLHRCTGFFAVGAAVSDPLVAAFPHHAARIDIVANPVSFDGARPEPVTTLRRWLFLGALIPRKGVGWLLEAFASCAADDGGLTLTLVGEGELGAGLRRRAEELGVAGRVTFAGAVAPAEALRLMREHDLLVHPSRMETFGMTIVEAVAAGMPVLVTRCGGPEETLAGIEAAAGEMIDVEEGSGAIVAGYRRLRDRFPHGLDLAGARAHLCRRFGYEAVADAHHRIWFGAPPGHLQEVPASPSGQAPGPPR